MIPYDTITQYNTKRSHLIYLTVLRWILKLISFVLMFPFLELTRGRKCGVGGYSMTWPKESVIRFYNVTV